MRSNINKIVPYLKDIPKGTTCLEVYYAHIAAVLERNTRNRTKTAKELKVCIRSLTNKIIEARAMGLDIPDGYRGGNVQKMRKLKEINERN